MRALPFIKISFRNSPEILHPVPKGLEIPAFDKKSLPFANLYPANLLPNPVDFTGHALGVQQDLRFENPFLRGKNIETAIHPRVGQGDRDPGIFQHILHGHCLEGAAYG